MAAKTKLRLAVEIGRYNRGGLDDMRLYIRGADRWGSILRGPAKPGGRTGRPSSLIWLLEPRPSALVRASCISARAGDDGDRHADRIRQQIQKYRDADVWTLKLG